LLQVRYPAEKETTELCKASLSVKGRPYEDGSHTQETRLLCRNHIDTPQQLCVYKGTLQSEMTELAEQRKGLYSQSRKVSGEEKEAVKARLTEISERMKFLRKEVRLCEGIEARSDALKEKLAVIRAEKQEQQRKELVKNEHRRRSGRTNRPNELGGL
jgi:hypothetical protein